MATVSKRWENLYRNLSLCNVPFRFANLRRSPFSLQYLTAILSLCPHGGHTLKTGIGSGFGAIPDLPTATVRGRTRLTERRPREQQTGTTETEGVRS